MDLSKNMDVFLNHLCKLNTMHDFYFFSSSSSSSRVVNVQFYKQIPSFQSRSFKGQRRVTC